MGPTSQKYRGGKRKPCALGAVHHPMGGPHPVPVGTVRGSDVGNVFSLLRNRTWGQLVSVFTCLEPYLNIRQGSGRVVSRGTEAGILGHKCMEAQGQVRASTCGQGIKGRILSLGRRNGQYTGRPVGAWGQGRVSVLELGDNA